MKSRLLQFLDNLRTSLWFIPTLMTVAAALLSFGALSVDEYLRSHGDAYQWLKSMAYSGNPEGARAMLAAIAGSMITVAGTVFSITIVALSLASSQFGPRLLRNFLRDRGNQAVLGTFVATFLFCILVMRRVLGPTTANEVFVPVISISFAVALGVLSLGVLIYFVHHIAQSMQAEQILTHVLSEVRTQIDLIFPAASPDTPAEGRDDEHNPPLPATLEAENLVDRSACAICSLESGYIQAIDFEGLLELASQHDLVIRLVHNTGNYLLPGGELVHLASCGETQLSKDVLEVVAEQTRRCFATGSHRTTQQNVEFGIDQIVEVAVRALSPGINDPFTAMGALERLAVVFALLATKKHPSPYLNDDQGRVRIISPPVTYSGLVRRAFDQIRQNARRNPPVMLHLASILNGIAQVEPNPSRRRALLSQLDAISEQIDSVDTPSDRVELSLQIERTRRALQDAAAGNSSQAPCRDLLREHQRNMEQFRSETVPEGEGA